MDNLLQNYPHPKLKPNYVFRIQSQNKQDWMEIVDFLSKNQPSLMI